ncbi:hypothetical protein [Luteolibacter sp. LG18]|uniref:hypothetical protein n=1 Tax=Luteolibacter sp. LG18 TaxID=2819286 RepID=UPI002B2D13FD|nr:hypothetical protein llg_35910 [Luteolibacter sp. LG18]
MKIPAFLGLVAVLSLSACRKPPAEVTVTETRAETSNDTTPKLFATSDERFRDKRTSPVTGTTPQGWLQLPSTQFRLLNYRFGESGLGEVSVGISTGSVLDNVNRWLGQFNAPKLTAETLDERRRVAIVDTAGVWVEADGTYSGGMAGAESRPGFALAGVVADVNGRILTVKMTGPKDEVTEAKAALEAFCKSLALAGE